MRGLIFLISLLFTHSLLAQQNKLQRYHNIGNSTAENKKQYHVHQNKNEIQATLSVAFIFYKTFISSQDANSCSFSPSCSEYGLEVIKRKGIFIGIPATFDRISRCNGMSKEHYRINEKSRLLLDPVQ